MEQGLPILRQSGNIGAKRHILGGSSQVCWSLQESVLCHIPNQGMAPKNHGFFFIIFYYFSFTFYRGPVNIVIIFKVKQNTLQGYLKASTYLSKYKPGGGWIEFSWTEGLTLTGGGTFDGQGAEAWPYNDCPTNINCKLLPTVHFVSKPTIFTLFSFHV